MSHCLICSLGWNKSTKPKKLEIDNSGISIFSVNFPLEQLGVKWHRWSYHKSNIKKIAGDSLWNCKEWEDSRHRWQKIITKQQ